MREYSLELSKAPSSEEGKKKDKDRKERKESQKERTKHTDGPKDSVSFIGVCITVELAPCMIVLCTRIGKCYSKILLWLFGCKQTLDDLEIDDQRKDLINKEIHRFRDAHKVRYADTVFLTVSVFFLVF